MITGVNSIQLFGVVTEVDLTAGGGYKRDREGQREPSSYSLSRFRFGEEDVTQ